MQRKRLHYRRSTAWIAVLGVCALVVSPAIAAANCCCAGMGISSADATCCSAESAAAVHGESKQVSGCHAAAGGDALGCCENLDATLAKVSQPRGTTQCCDVPSQCRCITCCGSISARHVIPTSIVRNQPDDQSAQALLAAELTLDTPWSIPTSSTHVADPIAFLPAQQQCARLCRWRK